MENEMSDLLGAVTPKRSPHLLKNIIALQQLHILLVN